jgi:DNA-binding GntR family transcriptional regulator
VILIKRHANETNHDYALRVIKEKIINLEFQPGSLLGEQQVADQLGLSRTPVHGAFLELSKTRIVEIYPQRGSFVSLINMSLVEEAAFMRRTLEIAILEQVCETATEKDLNNLVENVSLQKFYLQNDSPTKLLELDDAFHYYLYSICDKTQTYAIVNSMGIHLNRLRSMSLHSVRDLKIVEDHENIVEAVRARDKEQAKTVLTKHLSRYKFDKDELFNAYPDYFVSTDEQDSART